MSGKFSVIPAITYAAVNFHRFISSEEVQALNEQDRVVTFRRPRQEGVGLTVVVSNIMGSGTDWMDVGSQEFQWSEANQPPSAKAPNGLRAWADVMSGEEGQELTEAAKEAIFEIVKSAVPTMANTTAIEGVTVEVAARLQRVEAKLRWDNPRDNEVLVYVQFGSDEDFSEEFRSLMYTFWPDTTIDQRWPKQPGETDAAYEARLAVEMARAQVGRLKSLLAVPEFKTFCIEMNEVGLDELKRSTKRFKNINLDAIKTRLSPTYDSIKAFAGPPVPAPAPAPTQPESPTPTP